MQRVFSLVTDAGCPRQTFIIQITKNHRCGIRPPKEELHKITDYHCCQEVTNRRMYVGNCVAENYHSHSRNKLFDLFV